MNKTHLIVHVPVVVVAVGAAGAAAGRPATEWRRLLALGAKRRYTLVLLLIRALAKVGIGQNTGRTTTIALQKCRQRDKNYRLY